MTALLATAAVVLGGAAALIVGAVARRAVAIKRAVERCEADELEPLSPAPSLQQVPAIHLVTRLGREHGDVPLPSLELPLEGTLEVTERDLILHGESETFHIPLSRVIEPSFLPGFEDRQSGPNATIMRVEWERGGERLHSYFELTTRRHYAEGVRRELQMRAGKAALGSFRLG